jgi:hypothetical protein
LIATWKLEGGISQARCVRACFDAFDVLARKARQYRREFGAAVNFRAGLHCGPLVTGEMGSIKTEIVFLGDTVNTAARIQDLCRQTGDRILASADLIGRLQLPPGILKRSLGDLRLRGKGVDLALYALSKAGATASRRSRTARAVPASSSPIIREYPTTSAARIAASLRTSATLPLRAWGNLAQVLKPLWGASGYRTSSGCRLAAREVVASPSGAPINHISREFLD